MESNLKHDVESKEEQDRYERMRIPGLDLERLAQSRVLVVGAGGVGGPLLLYLAGAGIKRLCVAEGDTVSLTNLHRQILFRETDLGLSKADLTAKRLQELNSTVTVETRGFLTDEAMASEAMGITTGNPVDLVIECSDNAQSMRRIHDLALKHRIPALICSAEGTDFAVMYFDFKAEDYLEHYGCLGCLGYTPLVRRAYPGILGPVAGLCGVFAAGEVIKLLGGLKSRLYGHMAYFRNGELSYYELAADPDCEVHTKI